MVQTYAAVQKCFELPPHCFAPKPQVYSTVVKIFPRPPIFPINDRKLYAKVVLAPPPPGERWGVWACSSAAKECPPIRSRSGWTEQNGSPS
jgi:hypothetical protein